jgi:hypothetical protein
VKKFIQISFVVLVVIAIAVTVLSLTGTSSTMAGKVLCPNVGWNSRSYSCLSAAPQDLQGESFALSPRLLPQVGWNS